RLAMSAVALFLFSTGAIGKQAQQLRPSPTPVIVEVHEAQKSAEERAQEQADSEARKRNDEATLSINRKLVWVGWGQLGVFVLQLLVFVSQAYNLHQTVRAADKQARDMRDSIAESARAATALEALGTSVAASARTAAESVLTLRERTALQMRAYLTVVVGA